jgi:uncharacterized membrane protein (DUF485 family)
MSGVGISIIAGVAIVVVAIVVLGIYLSRDD